MVEESTQPPSPINEIPIDILCEIFSRCVDQSFAHVLIQPNTKIAPMLLCQVCATWRAVVLSVPFLWSHLRFSLPLNWHSNERPFTRDPELFMRRLEWLRWWRRNLGSMAPYLQVELQGNWKNHPNYRRGRLSKPVSEFLLEFMSSAQYISVGRIYRYLVQRRTEAGYVVGVHPKAHTIIVTWPPSYELDDFASCNRYLISVLTQTRSTLRHLVIEDSQLSPLEFKNSLNWSALIHLSLSLGIHLESWFFFIRSLGALQSGSFHLTLLEGDIETYVRPPVNTLPYLTVLHVSVSQHRRDVRQYPLKAVFDNLQLPALSTLSLESRSTTWNNAITVTDVDAALLSAPSITKLSLGFSFPGDPLFPASPGEAVASNVEPLAVYGPRLGHLTFVFRFTNALRRQIGLHIASRIITSTPWFYSKDPMNNIREVALIWSGMLPPEDLAAELVDQNRLISRVRRLVRDEMTVRFEEEEPVEVQRAGWGW